MIGRPLIVSTGSVAGGVASETWDSLQTAIIQILTAGVVYVITMLIDTLRKRMKKSSDTYQPE